MQPCDRADKKCAIKRRIKLIGWDWVFFGDFILGVWRKEYLNPHLKVKLFKYLTSVVEFVDKYRAVLGE